MVTIFAYQRFDEKKALGRSTQTLFLIDKQNEKHSVKKMIL